MKRALLLVPVVAALLLAGCSTDAYSTSDYSDDDSATVADAPNIPPGYTDGGNGIAWQFDNSGTDCSYYTSCIDVLVYAYQDCPSDVYVSTNALDSSGTVIGSPNGELASLSEGQTGKILVGTMDGQTEKFHMNEADCY